MKQKNFTKLSAAQICALSLSTLGVVFGDIGTSPLYALQACFTHGLVSSHENIFGVLSLIVWSLILVVSVKYVLIVMSASNHGEGGIMALATLAAGGARRLSRSTGAIAVIGLFGAALFFGDSIITPAISVLSAVEGLRIIAPSMDMYIMPIAIGVLVPLFLLQHFGTQKVGSCFGPIMVVWFVVIAGLGVRGIIMFPEVLVSIDPMYAVRFFINNGFFGFSILGFVLLSFTGVEALYADMGHFGAFPIRMSWFFVVLPALVLNYFGQGAVMLHNPAAAVNPFFFLVPTDFILPMVFLASAATVIASQAVISGAYSVAQQIIQLGFLPRMIVRHTSESQFGQVYLPKINLMICFGVLLLVLTFRTSTALSSAYGFAVMGTMMMTTLLVFSVARHVWRWSFLHAMVVVAPFFVIDLVFFGTAVVKIPDGGWLPLTIGITAFFIFMTWHKGRAIVQAKRNSRAIKLDSFMESFRPEDHKRIPGTAVYFSSLRAVLPPALINNLRHNKVLHDKVIVLNIHNEEEPRMAEDQRISVKNMGYGVWLVVLSYGFMERPNVVCDLKNFLPPDCPVDVKDTTFFVGKDVFVESDKPMMLPRWREQMFLWLSNNAADYFEYFRLPPDRVVELGVQVEI
ncbi:MAG: potassium transporter Kup [Alphaproteobacteria bacterium]|nr:potassium transporter Kup [Alphaproteobacteria bacterium]